MVEEQTQVDKNWLANEKEELNKQTSFTGEKLPALQFEENKIVDFSVDFSKPFDVYDDVENKCVKAIIPVIYKDEKKVLWLNKKNPLYKDLIHLGVEGKTEFKVMQIGTGRNTKYTLIKE